MVLPFSVEQFLSVFKSYNLSMWPAHILAYALGIAVVLCAFRNRPGSNRFVNIVLGLFWIFNGIAYHIVFFSTINKIAFGFGALFVIQGLLFLVSGLFKNQIVYEFKPNLASIVGILFIIYAMLLYPLIGYSLGHGYPFSPAFGLAPCPTVIYTFGMMLLAVKTLPRGMLIIPLIWSLIGFNAALSLGILEDTGLLAAGIVGTVIILMNKRTPKAIK